MPEWKSVSKNSTDINDWRQFLFDRIEEYTMLANWHLSENDKIGNVKLEDMKDKDLVFHLENVVMKYIKAFEDRK